MTASGAGDEGAINAREGGTGEEREQILSRNGRLRARDHELGGAHGPARWVEVWQPDARGVRIELREQHAVR